MDQDLAGRQSPSAVPISVFRVSVVPASVTGGKDMMCMEVVRLCGGTHTQLL